MLLDSGAEVRTPYDDSADYDPDWRWQIARYWYNTGSDVPMLPSVILRDYSVLECKEYLSWYNRTSGLMQNVVPRQFEAIHRARDWYTATTISKPKFRLEPLLLTGATYNIIASDMGSRVTVQDIAAYECLFFNIRDEKGALTSSCYTRTAFALPGVAKVTPALSQDLVWKAAGAQMGYTGLVQLWCWPEPNGFRDPINNEFISRELLRLTQAQLLNRVLTGEIINFDLSQMFVHYINNERLRLDSGKTTNLESVAVETMQNVLTALAPKMVDMAISVDTKYQADVALALAEKAKADYSVKRQMITDLGEDKGREAFEANTRRLFANTGSK